LTLPGLAGFVLAVGMAVDANVLVFERAREEFAANGGRLNRAVINGFRNAFTAIIVPPQAGILAVGAIAQRAVAVDGQVGVRPMMTLTLSSDHRVVDGARAAAFLNEVVETLEVVTKGDALWI